MNLQSKVCDIEHSILKSVIQSYIADSMMCVVQSMPDAVFDFTTNKTLEFVLNKYKFFRLIDVKTAFDLGNEGALKSKGANGKITFQVIASWLTEYKSVLQNRNVIELSKSEQEFIRISNDLYKSDEYARAVLYRFMNYSHEDKTNENIDITVEKLKSGILKIENHEKKQIWN